MIRLILIVMVGSLAAAGISLLVWGTSIDPFSFMAGGAVALVADHFDPRKDT